MSEVAKAADPLASTRHLATRSASEAPEPSLDIAMSSSPSLPETPPTLAALLDDARRQFLRLARAAQADEGEEESPLEVVITRGVTREAFDAMDEDLLHGLVVELRDDGTLVLVEVLSNEYSEAKGEIFVAAKKYTEANVAQGIFAYSEWQDDLDGDGPDKRKPPVAILQQSLGGFVPLVLYIVHVEGQSGSFRDLIRKASFYFDTIPDLARVVGVQFFERHRGRGADSATTVEVPAVAVAFGRGAQFAQDHRVRVLTARSFGNYPLHGNATNTLADPPDDVHLEPYADAVRLRDEWFHCVVRVDHVMNELMALEQAHASRTLVVPTPMVVTMLRGFPALQLPLFQIFVAAMRGWHRDWLARV